jgi:hypothetical protein
MTMFSGKLVAAGFTRYVASGFSRKMALLIVAASIAPACDKVPLLAPSGSSITVTAPTSVLPVGGSTEITAFVMESSSTPVQNGTTVRFLTNLGTVSPVEAQTRNGVATTTFTGTTSGTAAIRAVSGPAGTGGTPTTPTDPNSPTTPSSNTVTIAVGAAAVGTAGLSVRAVPASVPSTGGTVEVVATVLSTDGRLLSGVPVSFSASRGTVASTTAISDDRGEARTTLTTSENSTITARAGAATAATFDVTVRTGPSVTFTCAVGATTNCASVSVGQLVTFTAARGTTTTGIASARLDFGDGTSVSLGNLSSSVTVTHAYATAATYTAQLVVTDVNGETATAVQVVQVRGVAGVTLATSISGRTVTATATLDSASTDAVSYEWTFEGTTPNVVTTTNQATFTYATTGTKTITVRVTLRDGRIATGSTSVVIS